MDLRLAIVSAEESLMARTTTVAIEPPLADFVEEQVRTGRFSSASDVVQAGLRMLEEHESKVRALQDALIEGEKSGPASMFDVEDFLRQMRTRHAS
jgi:antitoxin ParD1/3/4